MKLMDSWETSLDDTAARYHAATYAPHPIDMLDRHALALLRPAMNAIGARVAGLGVGADTVTVLAFVSGMAAAACIANAAFTSGALVMLLSRLLDALDGAVARQTQATDAGGFLDITLDFVFYASIPLAFAVAAPAANALAAATLLASFMGTSASFLAFAALAAKRGMASTAFPEKSIYFLGGLTEATETLAVFLAMCLWPQHFAVLAFGFAVLCALTAALRTVWGWRALQ